MQGYRRTLILIIVIITIALFIVWPKTPGIHLGGVNKDFKTVLGLDLRGGVQALLEADLPADVTVDSDSMNSAKQIVENRVNGLGVTEAVIQQAGDRRIVVEIPGQTDPDTALAAIRQTGLLEFVDFSQLTDGEIAAISSSNAPIKTDFARSSGAVEPSSQITSTEGTTSTIASQVFHTVMTGTDLKRVQVVTTQTGEYQVSFELTDKGTQVFRDFTSQNVGKTLAIALDNLIISAPRIQNAITDGQGVITGNFTPESANALAVQLRYGSLPIPLKIITSTTVGPTLGQDSLQKSLVAGIIGVVVVLLFMALYYRLPGLLAGLALLIYIMLTFAIFRLIPITFTLPGIAGYILSIGVAVDANILIFERMREELRAGRTLHQATDLGWSRAWPSIRDSNLSTLITCLILFWFGSAFAASIVKGFSVTLMIGVLVSMFTAIIVTRTFLHLVLDKISFTEHRAWFGI